MIYSAESKIYLIFVKWTSINSSYQGYFTTVLMPKKIIKCDVSTVMHSAEVQYRSKHVLIYDPISIATEAKLPRAWINTLGYANNPQTWLYFIDGIGKIKQRWVSIPSAR